MTSDKHLWHAKLTMLSNLICSSKSTLHRSRFRTPYQIGRHLFPFSIFSWLAIALMGQLGLCMTHKIYNFQTHVGYWQLELSSSKCHMTTLMVTQYWFRQSFERSQVGVMASQISSILTNCLTACSCKHQRRHQSSTLLALIGGNPPVTMEHLSQKVSNARSVYISSRHHNGLVTWTDVLPVHCYCCCRK